MFLFILMRQKAAVFLLVQIALNGDILLGMALCINDYIIIVKIYGLGIGFLHKIFSIVKRNFSCF